MDNLRSCTLCPRNCKVNRLKGELGFCGSNENLKIAQASLHHYEEPCISGTNGSGTVFFSNCTLRCVFCQNHVISHESRGMELSIRRLSEIFLKLQCDGAHNINLVTPTHYVPQIIEALKLSKLNGLNIPIIYNSSGYENISTLKLLNGYIDVYLPDIKYYSDKYSIKYSKAPNYFSYASKALEEMVSQTGSPEFTKEGLIKKGVIVRHMMLPGLLFDSKKIIDYIYGNFEKKVYISIMNQFTPMFDSNKYDEINKPLNERHYHGLIDYALSKGITQGFIQEEGTCSKEFIPDFDFTGL